MSLYFWWIPAPPPPYVVATASRINRCVSGSFQRYLKLHFFVNGKSIKASNVKYDHGAREEAMETLRCYMDSPYKVGIKPVFRRRGIADSGVCAKVVWFPTSWRDGATIAVDSRSLHSRSCTYVRPRLKKRNFPRWRHRGKMSARSKKRLEIGNRDRVPLGYIYIAINFADRVVRQKLRARNVLTLTRINVTRDPYEHRGGSCLIILVSTLFICFRVCSLNNGWIHAR